ncbi:pilus assembly protein [Novosphingobium sp. KCTC 2891]|uniref:pilus assembly protein n=1 Tax=Novosphingobium sp. KCTC 2891 TaxID=2989730 RepID=UPI002222F58D|nr:pilus assembly protein [Novosphingobium sp. KCTC 2891]MCW1383490.1 pilus assembly protein [Novosphingobium sp. KCTC 2891]
MILRLFSLVSRILRLIVRRDGARPLSREPRGFMSRLARDRAGNTAMIVAGSMVPLLALVGGGVDVGRIYLVQSRLQQACDAGVLAARKELGTITAFNPSTDTARVADKGNRLFNVNFGKTMYGTSGRAFSMVISDDQSISGTASVTLPMAVMQFFGRKPALMSVACTAQLNAPNTDIMMALDVTGSMNETNSGDTSPKIAILKTVVKNFFTTMEAAKQTGSRMRYGFVPYSTNVNVGPLLSNDWMVTSWTYPSRTLIGTGSASGTYTYNTSSNLISGTAWDSAYSVAATYNSFKKTYSCSQPGNTLSNTTKTISTTSTPVTGPPAGTRTVSTIQVVYNGATYSTVALSGTTCTATKTTYTNYTLQYDTITEPKLATSSQWDYKDVTKDVSGWRTGSNGCIEERGTYEIADYDNVDLTKALDLDIDRVPTAGSPATQWRPQYPAIIYDRAMLWNGTGALSTLEVKTQAEYVAPYVAGFAACPAPAKKLQTWTAADLATYINGLQAGGSTYHDIGMIWAGRLLSPTGLFASENANASPSRPTSRHLIFLTDGQTSSYDLSYGAYGVEPLSKRRWSPSSALTLTQTVEKRFSFVCQQVRNRNITVWFIAFGTDLNPIMTECAGQGHFFSAANAGELSAAFEKIARSIGDLRLSQ